MFKRILTSAALLSLVTSCGVTGTTDGNATIGVTTQDATFEVQHLENVSETVDIRQAMKAERSALGEAIDTMSQTDLDSVTPAMDNFNYANFVLLSESFAVNNPADEDPATGTVAAVLAAYFASPSASTADNLILAWESAIYYADNNSDVSALPGIARLKAARSATTVVGKLSYSGLTSQDLLLRGSMNAFNITGDAVAVGSTTNDVVAE